MKSTFFHIASSIGSACIAAWLMNHWLTNDTALSVSKFFVPNDQAAVPLFVRSATAVVFGAVILLFSTYHRFLELWSDSPVVLQSLTVMLLVTSWGYSGYNAALVFGEALVFFLFLVPPMVYLALYYLEPPKRGPKVVVWSDPFYTSLFRRLLGKRNQVRRRRVR